MNKGELKNNLKSITDKLVDKENNEENKQQLLDTPTTTCMSGEEFKRISEAATDALTDMELKGYDIECGLRGVENVHLNNSKKKNNK